MEIATKNLFFGLKEMQEWSFYCTWKNESLSSLIELTDNYFFTWHSNLNSCRSLMLSNTQLDKIKQLPNIGNDCRVWCPHQQIQQNLFFHRSQRKFQVVRNIFWRQGKARVHTGILKYQSYQFEQNLSTWDLFCS